MQPNSNTSQILNPQSPIPLYRQLADILIAKIRAGEYKEKGKIPSEHQLSKAYGIGRPTARQATDLLIRKGLLVRKRGAGTFVCSPRKEVDLFSLGGTLSAFHRKGIQVSTELLSKVKRLVVAESDGNPFSAQEAFFFSRLSRVGKEPVLLEDIYMNPSIFMGMDRIDLHDRSLSQIVEEQFFLKPTGGKQTFRIIYPDQLRAHPLSVN
ncbi:MAG: GntR family transcriptional regulator, partial [Deltaproteobacteria bacterium]|nr:GntR family transcriptional regulator [Deltaproteobacteria bacterium]